jgi:dynein heavy chain
VKVFQGILLASMDRFQDDPTLKADDSGNTARYLACLWAHECSRVFCDKMVTQDDKLWIENTIVDLAK